MKQTTWKTNFQQRTITGAVLIGIFCITYFLLPPLFFSLLMISAGIIIITRELPRLNALWLAPCYPTLSIMVLIYLNHTARYHHLIFYAYIVTFVFDSGAYLIGSFMGKHYIAPHLSPKKTWEGTLGGFIACHSAVHLMLYTKYYSYIFTVMISIILSLAAFFGDLFVSFLKRKAQVKDTGTLLPGHGGLLDRLDSILCVIIIVYFFRNYLLLHP